jgi:hypothetical protein
VTGDYNPCVVGYSGTGGIDTSLRGNSKDGHDVDAMFRLTETDKRNLLEYLKSL